MLPIIVMGRHAPLGRKRKQKKRLPPRPGLTCSLPHFRGAPWQQTPCLLGGHSASLSLSRRRAPTRLLSVRAVGLPVAEAEDVGRCGDHAHEAGMEGELARGSRCCTTSTFTLECWPGRRIRRKGRALPSSWKAGLEGQDKSFHDCQGEAEQRRKSHRLPAAALPALPFLGLKRRQHLWFLYTFIYLQIYKQNLTSKGVFIHGQHIHDGRQRWPCRCPHLSMEPLHPRTLPW